MAVREILQMGNPPLRLKANAVDRFGDDKLVNLIAGPRHSWPRHLRR